MALNVTRAARTGRVGRRPQHTFQIKQRPFQIQPFFIAPVLPGETMKHLLMQSRIVTDPIRNPLVGWWIEHYFFYVKHRDMDEREAFQAMVLEPNADMASVTDASPNTDRYFYGGGIDWVKHCLNRVVDEYFRNESEIGTPILIDGVPAAQLTGNTWLDSVANEADWAPMQDMDLDANDDGTITAGEADMVMSQWQFMRQNNLTDMSYEDYLATYGIRPARAELHRPELVRFTRNWSYPSNTVDPTTGAPSSAVSWAVAERADKDRFFTEPGFLFGVTVLRPKVYLSKQLGTATSLLDNAMSWLPAVMMDHPFTSMRLVPNDEGPLNVTDANGYWVDIRDLFLYGEQFTNFSLASTDAGMVALPTVGLEKRYPTLADVNALFVDEGTVDPPAAPTAVYGRQDGIVSLNVLGRQVDHSATV